MAINSSLVLLNPTCELLQQAYRTRRKLYVVGTPEIIPGPEIEVEVYFSPKDQFLGLTKVMERLKENFWLLGSQDIGLLPNLEEYEKQISSIPRLAACHVSGTLVDQLREFVPYLGTWYSRQAMRQAGYLEENLDHAVMAARWGERASKAGWLLKVIHDPQAPTRALSLSSAVSRPRAQAQKPSRPPGVTVAIAHWGTDLALLNTVLNAWEHQSTPAYLHIIDTGSPAQVRQELLALNHDSIRVSLLQTQDFSPEEYECLAFDFALQTCGTPRLVFCHLDLMPQSNDFLRDLVTRISSVQPILGIPATPETDLISTALVALDMGMGDAIRLTASPRWLRNQYGIKNPQYPFLALNASLKSAGIKPKLLDYGGFWHIGHVVKAQQGGLEAYRKQKTQEVSKAIQETLIRLSRET